MGSRIARRESPGTRGGFVWDGTVMQLVDDFEIKTSWTGEESYHDSIEAVLRSRDRERRARGEGVSAVPLPKRRGGVGTPIPERRPERCPPMESPLTSR